MCQMFVVILILIFSFSQRFLKKVQFWESHGL